MPAHMNKALPAMAALAAASAAVGEPVFTPLGHLAGGNDFSQATSVSDDGQVVGGNIDGPAPGLTPVLWNGTAINELTVPAGFADGVFVNAISGDGQSAVGMGPGPDGFRGVRWDSSGTPHVLDDTPFNTHTSFNAINYDGTVAGGFVNQTFFPQIESDAAIWTQDGGIQNIGGLPGDMRDASITDVSNDGSMFVGYASDFIRRPVTWDHNAGFRVLQPIDGATGAGMALSISANGDFVTGTVERENGEMRAAYWDGDGEGHMLNLWDGYEVGEAMAASNDGSTIVGHWREDEFATEPGSLAFIWDADEGARPLQDVLMDDYGMDLDGWTLNVVGDMTPDGMTIVGTGMNPDGHFEAFKVTIPAPGTLALFALIGAAGGRRRRH